MVGEAERGPVIQRREQRWGVQHKQWVKLKGRRRRASKAGIRKGAELYPVQMAKPSTAHTNGFSALLPVCLKPCWRAEIQASTTEQPSPRTGDTHAGMEANARTGLNYDRLLNKCIYCTLLFVLIRPVWP